MPKRTPPITELKQHRNHFSEGWVSPNANKTKFVLCAQSAWSHRRSSVLRPTTSKPIIRNRLEFIWDIDKMVSFIIVAFSITFASGFYSRHCFQFSSRKIRLCWQNQSKAIDICILVWSLLHKRHSMIQWWIEHHVSWHDWDRKEKTKLVKKRKGTKIAWETRISGPATMHHNILNRK